jgi:hypothetical protein
VGKHILLSFSVSAVMLVTACAGRPASTANPASAVRFTHPTEITNPYYPVSLDAQAIYIGQEDGAPARNEVTLLPTTEKIALSGQQVEARISQFAAYSNGKLVEVAYDYFAQADDGSVYYLGEDVNNYHDGKITSHSGSWKAGIKGAPAALIMPAHPQVGQIYNPENQPGVVFETDEVMSLAEKAPTPTGTIANGILVKEKLMEGSIEYKVYAANFGIVVDRSGSEQLNLVLYHRIDAKNNHIPEMLTALESQVEDMIDAVPGSDWGQVTSDMNALEDAWQKYRVQAAEDHVPQVFLDQLVQAFDSLKNHASVHDASNTLQAANNLSAAIVDLYSVYNPVRPADLGRLDMLDRQVKLDASEDDFTAAADRLAQIKMIWVRIKPAILSHNGSSAAAEFERSLDAQQSALIEQNSTTLIEKANNALSIIDALENLF